MVFFGKRMVEICSLQIMACGSGPGVVATLLGREEEGRKEGREGVLCIVGKWERVGACES